MLKKRTGIDIWLDIIIYTGVLFAIMITLYPFIYIFSASISDPKNLAKGLVVFFPKGFSLNTYKLVFNSEEIWRAYYNTIWYVVVGTSMNLLFTLIGAYPLSNKKLYGKKFFLIFITITMLFSGGLIPSFILVSKLGLYNTRWAIVIPGLISAWNLIVCMTYFKTTISDDLTEYAKIEGCSDFRILKDIVLPLSKPIIATLGVFYGLGHWNNFFGPLLYLNNENLHPLQLYIRKITMLLTPNELEMNFKLANELTLYSSARDYYLQFRYVVIIISVLPIVIITPFLQKHFVKGVMIGSLKG